MKVSMQLDSKQLTSTFERTVVRVRRESKRIILEEAQEVMLESLAQVPRDTLTLMNSAFIKPLADGSVEIGYGDSGTLNPKSGAPAEDYMVEQHENLSLRHPNGGKAKFLEDPLNEHALVLEQKWAHKVQRAIRRAGQ